MRIQTVAATALILALGACSSAQEETTSDAVETPVTSETLDAAPSPAIPSIKSAIAPPAPSVDMTSYPKPGKWTVTQDWAGEWPPGFSVLTDGMVLQGRQIMDVKAPRDIACPLPKKLNVQQWNTARLETENWSFISAEPVTRIEVMRDVTVRNDFEEGPSLTLEAGDVGEMIQYHAEGAFTAKWGDREFIAYEDSYGDAVQFEDGENTDLWVNVRCFDGEDTRAWLFKDDLERTDGIGDAVHSEFGLSKDILDEDLPRLLKQNRESQSVYEDLRKVTPYDPDIWHISDGWGGEYPNSFAIAREGVVLMGYPEIGESFERNAMCPVPHKAAYHPWNTARNEADKIVFKTADYKVPLPVLEDQTIVAHPVGGDQTTQLALKAGSELTYLYYIAEGYFVAEYEGEQYEISFGELQAEMDSFDAQAQSYEWVNVACTDGTRAWLRYDETVKKFGVRVHGSTDYGSASDLP